VEAVKEILRGNPGLEINFRTGNGITALHCACSNHHDAVVSILLAHPNIEVNSMDKVGSTPFMQNCRSEKSLGCLRLLLMDSRVDLDRQYYDTYNRPLCKIAASGNLGALKWWLAIGREFVKATIRDAHREAQYQKKVDVIALIERFEENPEIMRSELRSELGIAG